MAKPINDVFVKEMYLIDTVSADVCERFYTKLLSQETYVLNDFISNPQGVDLDDLTAFYTQLVYSVVESIMQRLELTTAQQNTLTTKVTKVAGDYLQEQAVLIDFIREPEKVVDFIYKLAAEAVAQLTDKVIEKIKVPADYTACEKWEYQGAIPDVFPKV